MTAYQVLSDVVVELGIVVPEVRVDSQEVSLRQIVRHMNATGRELTRRAEWSRLLKTVEFLNPGGGEELPADFHKLVERGAVWIPEETEEVADGLGGFKTVEKPSSAIRLILSSDVWAYLSREESEQRYCHLTGGRIEFKPAINDRKVAMKYVSNLWAGDKSELSDDGDIFVFSNEIMVMGTTWRWRRQKGQPHDDMLAEYEAAILTEIKADRGAT